jgi:hypothetical protein
VRRSEVGVQINFVIEPFQLRSVRFVKPKGPIGLGTQSLAKDSGDTEGHYPLITRITAGGVAEKFPELCLGNAVVQCNGVDLTGLRASVFHDMVKKAKVGSEVHLLIKVLGFVHGTLTV